MKRNILLIVFITIGLVAGNVFGKVDSKKSKYALLMPSLSDGKNETIMIPLTEKEAKALLNKPAGMHKLNKPATIIDTLFTTPKNAGSTSGPYFGGDPGDTFAVYFSPGAGCKILEVAFNCGYWQNNPEQYPILWDGLNVSLNFANYDGKAEPGASSNYILGQWVNGVWTPNAWYAANYPNPPVGSMFWGSFPATIVATPSDVDEVIQMEWMNMEADCQGKDFVIAIVPYGPDNSEGGFDDTQGIALTRQQMLWKWYISTGNWHLRQSVGFYAYAVVEYYENTPPMLTPGGPYGSVLTSAARTLECYAVDIDASNDANAGIKEAYIVYNVNGGDWKKAPMSLAEGTNTDGLWKGDIPAGTLINPGDVLTFYFEMTDGGGLTSKTDEFSYGYFAKTTDILFYYNDETLSTGDANTYYWAQAPHMHDTWNGVADGAASSELLNMFDYIVRIDGGGPVNIDSDEFKAWLASGTAEKKKYLFWSSPEFLGYETDWRDTTYAADDWHHVFLGIKGVKHDLQYAAAGYSGTPNQPWPVNAVENDPITGGIAKLCKDSSFQLLNNPAYELGFNDWSDGLDAGDGAVACFTDSASGQPMGLHKDGATTKTVYIALDQLALDINPPYTNANYHWPEYESQATSVLYNALQWLGAPVKPAAVDNPRPGLVVNYNLYQNYPNPFNPETKISYSIAKAGLVKLAVYNVLGQKVAELVNGTQPAGNYQITWNATNMPSGVYFYRLESGDFTRTMKMMLLR